MTYGHTKANRLYRRLGECEGCGVAPATLRHHKDGNSFNNARENVAFLCLPCHREAHRVTRCRNGHDYTPENTFWNSQGRRVCRVCRDRSAKAYRERVKSRRP